MPVFDHDRMDAYRVARELNAGAAELASRLGPGRGDLDALVDTRLIAAVEAEPLRNRAARIVAMLVLLARAMEAGEIRRHGNGHGKQAL